MDRFESGDLNVDTISTNNVHHGTKGTGEHDVSLCEWPTNFRHLSRKPQHCIERVA